MPLVVVRYNEDAVSDYGGLMEAFGPALCSSIASRFTCEGLELGPNEIEVVFNTTSSLDIGVSDVNVSVEMMHNPHRHENFLNSKS